MRIYGFKNDSFNVLRNPRRCFSQESEAQGEALISDDELPPGVDLDDAFFSEELGGAIGQSDAPGLGVLSVLVISGFRIHCRRVDVFFFL